MGALNVNRRFQIICIILSFLSYFAIYTKLCTDPHVHPHSYSKVGAMHV